MEVLHAPKKQDTWFGEDYPRTGTETNSGIKKKLVDSSTTRGYLRYSLQPVSVMQSSVALQHMHHIFFFVLFKRQNSVM